MRKPLPQYIIAPVAAALLAAAGLADAAGVARQSATVAAPAASTSSGGTTSSSGTSIGTSSSSGTTTTGAGTTTTTGTASGTTSAALTGTVPTELNKSQYVTSTVPAVAAPVTTNTNTSTGSASGAGGIGSATTTFANGAQYVVNGDGTVTFLSGVSNTQTTNTNTTTATRAGTGIGLAAGTTGSPVNPVAADVFGTSAGQTSTGTAAGNSSAGIVDSGAQLANANAAVTDFSAAAALGGLMGGRVYSYDTGAYVDAGSGVNANGERVVSMGGVGTGNGNAVVASSATARTPTPTYDMVTRAAAAREANRRARGQTGRVVGLAPRTDNDRTSQMPDDPVIRY